MFVWLSPAPSLSLSLSLFFFFSLYIHIKRKSLHLHLSLSQFLIYLSISLSLIFLDQTLFLPFVVGDYLMFISSPLIFAPVLLFSLILSFLFSIRHIYLFSFLFFFDSVAISVSFPGLLFFLFLFPFLSF